MTCHKHDLHGCVTMTCSKTCRLLQYFYINKGTKHSNKRFCHSLSCDCLDPKYLIGICGIRAGITQQVSDGLSNNDVQIFVFPRRFLHRGTHYHRHFFTQNKTERMYYEMFQSTRSPHGAMTEWVVCWAPTLHEFFFFF